MRRRQTPRASSRNAPRLPGWLPWAALLLASFSFALFVLWGWTAPPPAATSESVAFAQARADLEARIEALEARLRRVESRPRALRREAPADAVAVRPVTRGQAPQPRPPALREDAPEPLELDVARSEGEATSTHEFLLDTLETEPLDRVWSAQREEAIRADLGPDVLGAAYVVGTECRSSLCRIELEHPEPASLDMLLIQVMARPALAGRRIYSEMDPDRPGHVTFFVGREGAPLPGDPAPPPARG